MIIHLEFSEKQQTFHNNYGGVDQCSNDYKTIFTGTGEQIDQLFNRLERAKSIRNNGFLTFERAQEIILNKNKKPETPF